MTPNEQRKTIAEACPHIFVYQQFSNGSVQVVHHADAQSGGPCNDFDPLTSLDAMHEAEKVLATVGQRIAYMKALSQIVAVPSNGTTAWEMVCKMSHGDRDGVLYGLSAYVSATAAQRAEAFLRTLGLWIDACPDDSRQSGAPK